MVVGYWPMAAGMVLDHLLPQANAALTSVSAPWTAGLSAAPRQNVLMAPLPRYPKMAAALTPAFVFLSVVLVVLHHLPGSAGMALHHLLPLVSAVLTQPTAHHHPA